MNNSSRAVLAAAIAAALCFGRNAHAANWLQLYNTSPPVVTPLINIWGFVQPDYAFTDGTAVSGLKGPASVTGFNGTTPNFNLVGPDQTSSNTFKLFRARIGARGAFSLFDNSFDYFLLTDFGNNSLTHFAGRRPLISDAFVTWNASKFARFSLGLQKVPGSWEEITGITLLPFVNFTTASLQNSLERFIDPGTPVISAGNGGYQFVPSSANVTGVNAFRDTGLKIFDWFDRGRQEYAYAFMAGNGGPITTTNPNSSLDTYGMLQWFYLFGGKGPYRNDAGLSVWFHNGRRRITQLGTYTLRRWGVDAEYGRHQRQRGGYILNAGYLHASGWILTPAPFRYDATRAALYSGPAQTGYDNLTEWTIYPGKDNTADGYYAAGGYYVTRDVEIEFRYDAYNRLTNSPVLQRDFRTWTVGGQYFFSPKIRITLNYEIASLDVPHSGAIANPVQRSNAEAIANAMGNSGDLELTAVF